MTEQRQSPELNQRARDVLSTLIAEYIRVGKPVGSRRLAKLYREDLSPATLRNVMADLEEMGYLKQPHTSAGRVPSRQAYRFHVKSLLKATRLPAHEIREIRRLLEEEADPEELMNKTSQILSSYSNSIGFVVSPPVSLLVMQHIEFLKLSSKRILVILVSRTGLVQHRLVEIDKSLSQSDLDQAGRYLVEHFSGQTLREIRSRLVSLMSEEKALYDTLLKNVVLLGSATLAAQGEENEEEPEVYLGGTSRVVQQLDVADLDRLISILQTIEQKNLLVKLITECLGEDGEGPSVTIGLEDHVPEMRNWALILSPYSCDRDTVGSLGILGPSRMQYERAIGLVDHVAEIFGQVLHHN